MSPALAALLAALGYLVLNFSIILAMWIFFPDVRRQKP